MVHAEVVDVVGAHDVCDETCDDPNEDCDEAREDV